MAVKSLRGVPELYDQVKQPCNLSLTPAAKAGLSGLAQKRGISRSELVERIGRGDIKIAHAYELTPAIVTTEAEMKGAIALLLRGVKVSDRSYISRVLNKFLKALKQKTPTSQEQESGH